MPENQEEHDATAQLLDGQGPLWRILGRRLGRRVRTALNHAYYGKAASPTDILVKGAVKNPQANALIGAVAKLAGGR